MQPWGSFIQLGSVFRWCTTHRHECSAAGALLICFAVVLNVHAMIKVPAPPLPPVPQAVAEPAIASSFIADRSQIDAARVPDAIPATSDPIEIAEQNPLDDLLSVPTDPFVRKVFVPVTPRTAEAEPQPAVVRQETADPAQPLATIAGIWVPEAGACSARTFREGLLPTIINPEGAWAGETFCTFHNARQTDTGWRVAAACSNSREHWTTEVRLSLKDDRLTWSSRRGTQVYARCAADFMMASR